MPWGLGITTVAGGVLLGLAGVREKQSKLLEARESAQEARQGSRNFGCLLPVLLAPGIRPVQEAGQQERLGVIPNSQSCHDPERPVCYS